MEIKLKEICKEIDIIIQEPKKTNNFIAVFKITKNYDKIESNNEYLSLISNKNNRDNFIMNYYHDYENIISIENEKINKLKNCQLITIIKSIFDRFWQNITFHNNNNLYQLLGGNNNIKDILIEYSGDYIENIEGILYFLLIKLTNKNLFNIVINNENCFSNELIKYFWKFSNNCILNPLYNFKYKTLNEYNKYINKLSIENLSINKKLDRFKNNSYTDKKIYKIMIEILGINFINYIKISIDSVKIFHKNLKFSFILKYPELKIKDRFIILFLIILNKLQINYNNIIFDIDNLKILFFKKIDDDNNKKKITELKDFILEKSWVKLIFDIINFDKINDDIIKQYIEKVEEYHENKIFKDNLFNIPYSEISSNKYCFIYVLSILIIYNKYHKVNEFRILEYKIYKYLGEYNMIIKYHCKDRAIDYINNGKNYKDTIIISIINILKLFYTKFSIKNFIINLKEISRLKESSVINMKNIKELPNIKFKKKLEYFNYKNPFIINGNKNYFNDFDKMYFN